MHHSFKSLVAGMSRTDKKRPAVSKSNDTGYAASSRWDDKPRSVAAGSKQTSDIGRTPISAEENIFPERLRTTSPTSMREFRKDPVYDDTVDILLTPGRHKRWGLYTPNPVDERSFTSECRGDIPKQSPRLNENRTAIRREQIIERSRSDPTTRRKQVVERSRNDTATVGYQANGSRSLTKVVAPTEPTSPALYLVVDPDWDASQGDATVFVSSSPEDFLIRDYPVLDDETREQLAFLGGRSFLDLA